MADILGLDTYVIGRPNKFSLSISYDGYDTTGNKLFDVKRKFMSEKYSLIDASGSTIGMMHRKLVAVTPTYDLYEGDGKTLIGKVVEEINISAVGLGGKKSFMLEDAQGAKLAHVSISSPLAQVFQGLEQGQGLEKSLVQGAGMAYDVTSIDGTKVIAKMGMVWQQNYGVRFGNNVASFVINIIDRSVSTLLLIEFAIAVDHLYSAAQMSNTNRNFGNTPPGFGGGGGGFGIKFG